MTELDPQMANPYITTLVAHQERSQQSREKLLLLFLMALAETGNIRKSCEKADVSLAVVKMERKRSPDFDEAFEFAQSMGREALEAEAFRRAVDGVEEEVFYQGTVVSTKKVYSDTLLKMLLQGAYPEKYGNRGESTDDGNKSVDEIEQLRFELARRVGQADSPTEAGANKIVDATTT